MLILKIFNLPASYMNVFCDLLCSKESREYYKLYVRSEKKNIIYDSNRLIGLELNLFYETLFMQQYARLLNYSYW